MKNKEIPISEAKALAEKYGHEQIVILAMNDGGNNNFLGWATTFNKFKSKCKFLGKIATILHNNLKSFYSNEEMTQIYYEKCRTFKK